VRFWEGVSIVFHGPQGDIILAADGNTMSTLRELETYCMFRDQVIYRASVFLWLWVSVVAPFPYLVVGVPYHSS
jgi:hypothetical protein